MEELSYTQGYKEIYVYVSLLLYIIYRRIQPRYSDLLQLYYPLEEIDTPNINEYVLEKTSTPLESNHKYMFTPELLLCPSTYPYSKSTHSCQCIYDTYIYIYIYIVEPMYVFSAPRLSFPYIPVHSTQLITFWLRILSDPQPNTHILISQITHFKIGLTNNIISFTIYSTNDGGTTRTESSLDLTLLYTEGRWIKIGAQIALNPLESYIAYTHRDMERGASNFVVQTLAAGLSTAVEATEKVGIFVSPQESSELEMSMNNIQIYRSYITINQFTLDEYTYQGMYGIGIKAVFHVPLDEGWGNSLQEVISGTEDVIGGITQGIWLPQPSPPFSTVNSLNKELFPTSNPLTTLSVDMQETISNTGNAFSLKSTAGVLTLPVNTLHILEQFTLLFWLKVVREDFTSPFDLRPFGVIFTTYPYITITAPTSQYGKGHIKIQVEPDYLAESIQDLPSEQWVHYTLRRVRIDESYSLFNGRGGEFNEVAFDYTATDTVGESIKITVGGSITLYLYSLKVFNTLLSLPSIIQEQYTQNNPNIYYSSLQTYYPLTEGNFGYVYDQAPLGTSHLIEKAAHVLRGIDVAGKIGGMYYAWEHMELPPVCPVGTQSTLITPAYEYVKDPTLTIVDTRYMNCYEKSKALTFARGKTYEIAVALGTLVNSEYSIEFWIYLSPHTTYTQSAVILTSKFVDIVLIPRDRVEGRFHRGDSISPMEEVISIDYEFQFPLSSPNPPRWVHIGVSSSLLIQRTIVSINGEEKGRGGCVGDLLQEMRYIYISSREEGFDGQMRYLKVYSHFHSAGYFGSYMHYASEERSSRDGGLMGYWKLDEGGGFKLVDYSEYMNNGDMRKTSTYTMPSWGDIRYTLPVCEGEGIWDHTKSICLPPYIGNSLRGLGDGIDIPITYAGIVREWSIRCWILVPTPQELHISLYFNSTLKLFTLKFMPPNTISIIFDSFTTPQTLTSTTSMTAGEYYGVSLGYSYGNKGMMANAKNQLFLAVYNTNHTLPKGSIDNFALTQSAGFVGPAFIRLVGGSVRQFSFWRRYIPDIIPHQILIPPPHPPDPPATPKWIHAFIM